jgi:hypothetical protein
VRAWSNDIDSQTPVGVVVMDRTDPVTDDSGPTSLQQEI